MVTAVTLAISENWSKMAYFSHSAGTAQVQRKVTPLYRTCITLLLRKKEKFPRLFTCSTFVCAVLWYANMLLSPCMAASVLQL